MDAKTDPSENLKEAAETDLVNVKKDTMKPRPLTEEEITDILNVIPQLKSSSSIIAEYNRKSMLKTLREQLKEIIVTPLGINDVKSEIIRQFNEALIKPGSVVGVTAAEALGQPITQMALNAFHQSGSSKNVSYGVDRIRELINASKELKNTSCSIFFKNQNLSFDDIITKVRPAVTEISVKDIVKGIPDIESTDTMEDPWWYGPYRMLIRDDFESDSVLRLELDVNMMYAYKISMADVARVVEQDRSVVCVYSPLNIGKIHIYPVQKSVAARIKTGGIVDPKNASMIFLWEAVIPALDNMKITGIKGIAQIYPVEAPVWQIVKDEYRSGSVERGWYLRINEVRQRITGISIEKLIHLCKTVGMKIFRLDPNRVGVQTPTGESPTEVVNAAIKADKEDEKKYEEAKRKEGARVIRRPPTEIMTASHLVYADSDGSLFKGNKSTLRSLLSNPNVDSTRTYSNNVHEINEVLGIEAARSFLIKEFSDVIGYEGSYVNPRHIVLLIDFMVSLGQVNGITFTGISRQPIGALEKASFEKAMDTFKEASGFGELKEVKGTSASIYVGKKALIGTGYSEQYMDRSKYKEIEKEIEFNPDMKLDIGAFRDAIGEMTDIVSGADVMLMEGVEEEMFGGDGPFLPDGMVMSDINQTPDPRVHKQVKGPMVRAPELELAAQTLNEAPCLAPLPQPKIRVEDLTQPIQMEEIPFAGPAEAPLPLVTTETTTFTQGAMGLPEDLLAEMEQFTYMKPPQEAVVPALGLPPAAPDVEGLSPLGLPPLTTASTPSPTETEGAPAKIMFDLDTFLG